MRGLSLSAVLAVSSVISGVRSQFQNLPIHNVIRAPDQFINDTGLTDLVGWDPYSFFIKEKRIFLHAGEFHGWRLPSISLWKDIMQKTKASGLNSISMYVHWHLTNPKKGVIDLEGINDLQPFFDAAKAEGLWVIARPGPYINSETTAGGIPGHVLTIPGDTPWNLYNGVLRSNATSFHDSWQDYFNAVIPIIAKNQITQGGPIIMVQVENEYYNGAGQNEYVEELRQSMLRMGIVVPTSVNDPGMFQNLVDSANIYGIDAYPVSFNCSNPTFWRDIPTAWRTYHKSVTPSIPFFFPEFQGGGIDRWGSTGGYEGCRQLTNPNFQRIYNHHLWANGVTAIAYYMFYGGTSWGQIPHSSSYTSYDWGAAVRESRALSEKYDEVKLQALFLRSFPDMRMTDWIGEDNTTVTGVSTTHLRNPVTGSSFYITRHVNTSTWDVLSFDLTVGMSGARLPVVLPGRDGLITVADLPFGKGQNIVYSTTNLLSTFNFDGEDTLVVYGTVGMTYQMAFTFDAQPKVTVTGPTKKNKAAAFTFSVASGMTSIHMRTAKQSLTVLLADYKAATKFWMPTIAAEEGGDFKEFEDMNATTPFLISGPYLVRKAVVEDSTLALTGDLEGAATTLMVFGTNRVKSVSWNGARVAGAKRNSLGAIEATLTGPSGRTVDSINQGLPNLMKAKWKYADSLPEIKETFDESGMVLADHTETTSKFPPYYGGPWVLYADDYGFHGGNLVWRGTFEHSANADAPTAVNISVSGGQFFAASAWLNEHYLGDSYTSLPTNNESWPVTPDMLREGKNYVTVLQDHMGHNLAGQLVCCTPGGRQRDVQQPKGIQGYYLEGRKEDEQFTKWMLAGNLGGEDFPDKTRKILNEGGLYAERMGWHLPGFDDSAWESRTPFKGLDRPGVGFFRTTFKLNLPADHDILLSIVFDSQPANYRAQLYVNGWQMGKRVANVGPQDSFVVQEGILNYHGENTVAVSLWSLGRSAGDLRIPSLKLVATGIYRGGVGAVAVNNPGWDSLRGV
ncbi:glycoside hydrolase family 35 protein [Collybia nuda]|uniref:Beta-galactosidase n=1 Tax=Collybia nuda TaxID=64659 RepID=A0A9P6CM53_9AGAR|nr:glycoside hydrolase family 35 protein [Collybia nuda]